MSNGKGHGISVGEKASVSRMAKEANNPARDNGPADSSHSTVDSTQDFYTERLDITKGSH